MVNTRLMFLLVLCLWVAGCEDSSEYDNSGLTSEVETKTPSTTTPTSETTIPFVAVGGNGAIFTSSVGIT